MAGRLDFNAIRGIRVGTLHNYIITLENIDNVNILDNKTLPAKEINYEQMGEVEFVNIKLASGHELQIPKRRVIPRSVEVTLYDSDARDIRIALRDYFTRSGLNFSKAPVLNHLKDFTLILDVKLLSYNRDSIVLHERFFVVPSTGFLLSLGQDLMLDINNLTFQILGQDK